MKNDIFVLYKQEDTGITSGVNEFVRNLSGKTWETTSKKSYENTITIKEYKENAGEANRFESQNSSVLVCIVDYELFYDSDCRKIWDYFWNLQLKNEKQIIFPVLAEIINAVDFNTDKKNMFDSIRDKLGVYVLSDRLDMEKFYPLVYESIDSLREMTSTGDMNDSNVHQINEPIPSKVGTTENDYTELKEKLESAFVKINREFQDIPRRYTDKPIKGKVPKPVCVIFTGGTAGSVHDEYGKIVNADIYQLIANLPLIKKDDFKFDIDFCRFKDLFDSSNMGSKHWVIIAKVIERLYDSYQGFVIIQGVNTMAYTASALSFMLENVDKPIILTGAELPLTAPHSDAPQNIQKAIEIAAHESRNEENISDICILFGRRLIKGNRATKQIALDTTEGFYAPNFYDMATVAHDRYVIDARYIIDTTVRPRRRLVNESEIKLINNENMCIKDSVSILDVYPDMNMKVFKDICENNIIEAIILRTYGTGGVPDASDDFRNCLALLHKKKKLVVILTQCPKGTVEFRIAETNATLFNYGVISGGDMVTEAAYCKLKYLLDKFKDAQDDTDEMKELKINAIKHYMMVNINGELSMNMFIINIYNSGSNETINVMGTTSLFKICLLETWADNPAKNLKGTLGSEKEKNSFGGIRFKDEYAEFPSDPHFSSAVLRLSGVKIITNRLHQNLLLSIEIFISDRDEHLMEKSNAYYKENIAIQNNVHISMAAIDIDITNRANEMLRKDKKHYILIKFTDCIVDKSKKNDEQIHMVTIEKADILLSVKDKARLEGSR